MQKQVFLKTKKVENAIYTGMPKYKSQSVKTAHDHDGFTLRDSDDS